MANEYALLSDLKSRMQIVDTGRDGELADALETASRDVDRDTGRRFWLDDTVSARTFNPRYRQEPTSEGVKLFVDDIGDLTGLIVEVGTNVGGSSWSAVTDFEPGPDNAMARGEPVTWLLRTYIPWVYWPRQRIRITAKWGWPAVPPQVKSATLLRAARLFKRRESPDGLAGAGDFGPVRVSRWDPDYDALIGPFTIPAIG